MAASNLNLGKASGGVLNIQPADGTTTTSLVLPAINGTVVAADSNGNIVLPSGSKIQGDFSNATESNKTAFQTSTVNAATVLNIIPNGTSRISVFRAHNNSDVNNSSFIQMKTDATASQIYCSAFGTAPLLPLQIITGGTVGTTFDTAGNVGIGVAPSAWSSGFNAIEGNSGSIVYRSSNSGLELWQNAYSSYGANAYKATAAASRYAQQGGQHTWFTAPSGTAGNAITWTNTMTLDTSGNLTVGGNSTAPVIVARYDSNNYIYIQGRNVADTTEVYINLIGGVKKSAILANGTYQSATNVYGSTSDIKLKENVVETSDKLNKLMNVRVVNFNYIGDDQKQIGVIAQEIEQIFPSVVFETKDTKQVEVTKTKDITDEDGNVTQEEYTEIETVETGEVTKNVKYSIIYMMMLKGMQEMRAEYTAEIESLKARIEILEGAK